MVLLGLGGGGALGPGDCWVYIVSIFSGRASLGGLLGEVGWKRTLRNEGGGAGAGGDCVGGVLGLLHDVWYAWCCWGVLVMASQLAVKYQAGCLLVEAMRTR